MHMAEFYLKNLMKNAFKTSATKSHEAHMDVHAHRRIQN
jgi:hypothetical protein